MRALWEVLEIDIEEVLKVERENVIYRKALFRCLDVDILNICLGVDLAFRYPAWLKVIF